MTRLDLTKLLDSGRAVRMGSRMFPRRSGTTGIQMCACKSGVQRQFLMVTAPKIRVIKSQLNTYRTRVPVHESCRLISLGSDLSCCIAVLGLIPIGAGAVNAHQITFEVPVASAHRQPRKFIVRWLPCP